MQNNNLIALMEEISRAVGVEVQAGVSFTCPMASGDAVPFQPSYGPNPSLDSIFPPSPHSSHTDLFVNTSSSFLILGLFTTCSLYLGLSLLRWS